MANLLLVDDDQDLLTLGRRVLATAQHNVWVAETVVHAIDILQNNPIDLIITDANMRPYSGYEFLQTVRHEREFRHLPVIMLTARRAKRDIERAIEMGVNDYIIKPLVPVVLIDKVDQALTKYYGSSQGQESTPPNELDVELRAEVIFFGKVTSLSEVGAVLEMSVPVSQQAKFRIDCKLFQELGVEPPMVRVLSTVKRNELFEVRTQFLGLDEKYQMRIRTWLSTQVLRKAA